MGRYCKGKKHLKSRSTIMPVHNGSDFYEKRAGMITKNIDKMDEA